MPGPVNSVAFQTITVSSLPANAELAITLKSPDFAWTNENPASTTLGVELTGLQGTAFPLVSMVLTTTSITMVMGEETGSFILGIPISFPNGSSSASGVLTVNTPANVAIFMSIGGEQQPVAVNAPWTVQILP